MKIMKWQAVFFATCILWGLVGANLAFMFAPRATNAIQTTIQPTSSTSPHFLGLTSNAKYDRALMSQLKTGVGENEVLNVIILLDPQDPQAIAARNAIANVGGAVKYEYRLFPGIVATVPATGLADLAEYSSVARICADRVIQLPEDTSPASAAVNLTNWWRAAVGADSEALAGLTGKNIKIAILDTGLGFVNSTKQIEYHADFTGKVILSENFALENNHPEPSGTYDWVGHGTHTAGIAVGSGVASGGTYKGIAPGASLLVGKVLNSSGGDLSTLLLGVQWAVENGAQIISMSLGVDGYPEVFTAEGLAMEKATEQGALVIASAGNSGPDYYTGGMPGSALYTLSVGASDHDNKFAAFSSAGPTLAMQSYPSIVAPGVDIIAPLCSESAIEREEIYLGNVIPGSGDSDYVALSGTSMSAPIVAGAAALLLEKYSTANPTTLRMALMESATENGLLNIPGALAYLAALLPNNINNVTEVYPKQLPFAPYDLLKFPGDAQTMNLTVLSGIARNISVDLPKIDGIQLNSSQEYVNFTNAGAKLWNLTVKIDLNATVGEKSGLINFTDSKTGEILDTVSFKITVTLPKRRVYFDSFHGLNDNFYAVLYGTTQYQLYNFAKAFTAKNYSVDLKQEFWTPEFDPGRDGRLLTYDLLQNYDAVVLQTPSLPYTPTEVQALVDFRARNGSILVIGDRYQSLTLDSTNDLLAKLGTGISFLPSNLESIQFYGLYGLRSSFLLTPPSNPDSLLAGVQSLVFEWGALLQTSGSGISVLGNTIAAKSNGDGTTGNVVVLSGPSLLTNTWMTDPDYGGNHTRFASNLIDYLLPAQDFNMARRVTPERSETGDIDTYLYVTDGTTGQPVTGLESGTDLTLTCSNATGFVEFVNVTMVTPGIYVNISYALPSASLSPYFLNATTTVNLVHRNATGAAIRTTANPPRLASNWQSTPNWPYKNVIDRDSTSSGTINVFAQNTTINNLQLYAGSTPFSAFNVKPQYSFKTNVPPYGLDEFRTTLNARNHTSGFYTYFYEGNNTDGYTNIYSSRTYFIVVNYDPVISESASSFDQDSFTSLIRSDGSYTVNPVKQLETHSFSVSAEEQVDFEDWPSQLTGVIVFFPVYLLNGSISPMIGDGQLPHASMNNFEGYLEGQIVIPSTLTFPKGDGTVINKSTASDGNYLAIFEVAVMDSEGGYTDYFVILRVEQGSDLLLMILIIIAIIGGFAVLAYVLSARNRSRKARSGAQYQSPYETSSESSGQTGSGYAAAGQTTRPAGTLRKFCIYCGQPIPLEAIQCPYCKANFPSSDTF